MIVQLLLGYGLAGIMRKFVVEPAHMWWPNSLVQVSFFRALHEKDNGRMPRRKFFYIALICSCAWYVFPGYLFEIMASISWVYWAFPKSVTAHQIGSGIDGLGLGSFSLDLSTVFSSLGSPLITPFFTIVNILVGDVLALYVIIPIAYYVLNTYHAQRSPIVSLGTFNSRGKDYDVLSIVNDKLEINLHSYEQKGPINFSISFTFAYGISMAAAISILTHVAFFNGKEILGLFRASFKENKVDIHTKLMRKYKDIPNWWFYMILGVSLLLTLHLCIFQKDQIQLPWWSAVFAIGLAFAFTLPMSIITATTNQTPTLDVITQYIMGMMLPGRPIANLCFKTYGAISTTNAIHFLNNFKMCHYMKIPPRSRFLVEFTGTIMAGTINLVMGWWLMHDVKNICQRDLLPPHSPWECSTDRSIFQESVFWGLIGPRRMSGSLGNYFALEWFFLGGALGPIIVWLLHKVFPNQKWIPLINLPVTLGAIAMLTQTTSATVSSWIAIGIIFNYLVNKHKNRWWQEHNSHILSAALDGGSVLMTVLLHMSLQRNGLQPSWWGNKEHCDLATLPREQLS
ncbi:hypothetical protein SLE2022_219760 [Rubroshorea leprosula]